MTSRIRWELGCHCRHLMDSPLLHLYVKFSTLPGLKNRAEQHWWWMNSCMYSIRSLLCVKCIFCLFSVTRALLSLLPLSPPVPGSHPIQDWSFYSAWVHTGLFSVSEIGIMSPWPCQMRILHSAEGIVLKSHGLPQWLNLEMSLPCEMGYVWNPLELHPSCVRAVEKTTVLQRETPKLKSSISCLVSDLGKFT